MYLKRRKNKMKKDSNYIYVGLNAKFNGRIIDILNYYYGDDKKFKNKEVNLELIDLGKRKVKELKEKGINYLNKGTKNNLYYFGRCPETYYYKGDVSLLEKSNLYLFSKLNEYKDKNELNKKTKELSKTWTLIFKKEELDKDICVPKGSIIYIKSDFINEVGCINDDGNLYISASLKIDADYKFNIYYNLPLLIEKISVIDTNMNELLLKENDLQYTPEEIEEIKLINRNLAYKTKDHSKEELWKKAFLTNRA